MTSVRSMVSLRQLFGGSNTGTFERVVRQSELPASNRWSLQRSISDASLVTNHSLDWLRAVKHRRPGSNQPAHDGRRAGEAARAALHQERVGVVTAGGPAFAEIGFIRRKKR